MINKEKIKIYFTSKGYSEIPADFDYLSVVEGFENLYCAYYFVNKDILIECHGKEEIIDLIPCLEWHHMPDLSRVYFFQGSREEFEVAYKDAENLLKKIKAEIKAEKAKFKALDEANAKYIGKRITFKHTYIEGKTVSFIVKSSFEGVLYSKVIKSKKQASYCLSSEFGLVQNIIKIE